LFGGGDGFLRLDFAHARGGGPGAFAGAFDDAVARWAAHRRWHLDWRQASRDADAALTAATSRLTDLTPVVEQATVTQG